MQGFQQTGDQLNRSHWTLTIPGYSADRAYLIGYGSIIITVICHRSSGELPRNFPNEQSPV